MATPRSIRFPEDMAAEIEQRASKEDRSFNGQVIHLIRVGLSGGLTVSLSTPERGGPDPKVKPRRK